jgi:hemoglobin
VPRPSIFESAGGEPAFRALAEAHHVRCLADPVLNHPFDRPEVKADHVERLAVYWAEVFGGPADYSATYGDHTSVLRLHCGEDDMRDLGERFLSCFVLAADDAGLPADPQLRQALRAYMEWAVAQVLSYSPHESVVPDGLGVPRWSWEGLVSEPR